MKEKIIEAITRTFEINESDLPSKIDSDHIEAWDSLNHLNLIVELEDVFDTSYEPEEITKMTSLAKISEITEKKLNSINQQT